MNELEEVGIHDVPDHLSTSNDLSVKFVQDVLEEIPFLFILRFEKLYQALDELGVYELLDHTLVNMFARNHPVEELIYVLEVRPGRVAELLLLDTGVLFLEISEIELGQRPKHIGGDRLEDLIKVWKEEVLDVVRVIEELKESSARSQLLALA